MKTIIFSFGFIVLFGVQATLGCSCPSSEKQLDLRSSYETADGVILGKIVSRSNELYRVKVDIVWKGKVENEILAIDIYDGTSCGASLKRASLRYFFLASANSESGGRRNEIYRNALSPIRIENKQVFFIRPCAPIVEVSVWNRYRSEYDKSGFWLTLGDGREPLQTAKNR